MGNNRFLKPCIFAGIFVIGVLWGVIGSQLKPPYHDPSVDMQIGVFVGLLLGGIGCAIWFVIGLLLNRFSR